jgi:flagellar M-ring protein FliF
MQGFLSAWREYWPIARGQLARVPLIAWAVAGVFGLALTILLAVKLAGPPYVALYDGLNPADGGKVIAALQKLGIPYQLQSAGNIILVPAPDLANARLQLGAINIPGDNVNTGWDKLENAPMTISDLAQNTLATRALEASLADSINSLNGISGAQVYLALPPSTPFLADQPKPAASVMITAAQADAQIQGPAIAKLVAGAVPGLDPAQITVATTAGISIYPAGSSNTVSSQFATVAKVESEADARIALLLTPLVGQNNFRANVAANLDFTQAHIHQISYGPNQLVTHKISSQSSNSGSSISAIGIPGAMSNEPPAATIAAIPGTSAATPAPAPPAPNISKKSDETYVTDESESDINKPDWRVDSISVSVVLNKAALNGITPDQIKTAIASAFAYKQVNVNVLAANFEASPQTISTSRYLRGIGPLTQSLLELMAAAALLLGVAMPIGRRLGIATGASLPALPPHRPIPTSLPPPDFSSLREVARGNPAGVARLLQTWAEDNE